MDNLNESEITPSAVDDFLSLPRLDRLAVYRQLSVSDRMRLDREVKRRKSDKSKKKKRGQRTSDVADGMNELDDLSPWLSKHIRLLLEEHQSLLGVKTEKFLREKFILEESVNA